MTFVPGDVVARRFEVRHFLGQGGMGQVFEAFDVQLGVPVALKVVRPGVGREDALRNLEREVQVARELTHPNVCRVYDLVAYESAALRTWGARGSSLVLLTMEMLRGQTLAQRLRHAGPFSPEDALPIALQMAQALDAAHQAGVVHRDFKSANVILVAGEDGEERRAVVTDFGLAVIDRPARHGLSDGPPAREAGDGRSPVNGTPAYVAPELVAGDPPSTAADVYSFGVVLYEMMTGRLPFLAETPDATARLRLETDPQPPSDHRPELAQVWDDVVLRCLSRDSRRRFARASEAVEVLFNRGRMAAETADARHDARAPSGPNPDRR